PCRGNAVPRRLHSFPTRRSSDLARARAVHPRLREAEAAVATARARSATARGTRWPTIDASFGFNRSTSRSGFEAFGEVNPLNRGDRKSTRLNSSHVKISYAVFCL